MHDIADLERRNTPGVFIASSVFVDAAATQAKALGFKAKSVFVEHPIQDRSDDEMRTIAMGIIDSLVAAITIGA